MSRIRSHSLLQAVVSATREFARGAGMVLGISGGADSVALARAVIQVAGGDVSAIVIGHLDHGLRQESSADADWVREFAMAHGVKAVIEERDVRAFAESRRLGIEEAARRCRYDFLCRVAVEQECQYVAVAHTADDLAETILHHLIRGTGLAGLKGIPTTREMDGVTLFRPLLAVTREQVLKFLAELDQPYLSDDSNLDPSFTRNRIRHSLLPLLREEFNPNVTEALLRLGVQAQETHDVIVSLAKDCLATAISEREAGCVTLTCPPLRSAARHVVREAFRLLFAEQNWPRQRMGFDDWGRLADLARTSRSPKSLSLPEGMTARFRRGVLTIERS